MNPLEFIVEPRFLLLTWQPTDETASQRTRRIVAVISPPSGGEAKFRYLKGHPDYEMARDLGFQGFPAFDLKSEETARGVMAAFMRRLPSRNREDFSAYLARHRLPTALSFSDFALLGYTGAKLPSDGFALVPMFDPGDVPCDYITEVAGLRHVYQGDVSSIGVGDPIELRIDPQNLFEADAIEVRWQGHLVGFIDRALRITAIRWLNERYVSAVVDRINGKSDRPLMYVRLRVRSSALEMVFLDTHRQTVQARAPKQLG